MPLPVFMQSPGLLNGRLRVNLRAKSIADIYEIQRGLADSDTQIERITTVTNPRNVSADSDFGFTEYIDLTDPFTDSA